MADENLSLRIIIENTREIAQQINGIKSELRSMGAVVPKTAGFDKIKQAAVQTRGILDKFGKPVQIPVDTSGLSKAERAAVKAASSVKKTGEAGKRAAQQLQQSRTAVTRLDGAFASLASSAKIAAGAFLGISAFNVAQRALAGFNRQLSLAKTLFIDTQAAVLRFASGLQATGRFTERAIRGIQSYASEIQNLTGISDDAVIQASALIAQLGGLAGPQLTRATDAAIELSKVLSFDLQTAALLVAKAAQGNTTQFQRYGIVVDRMIPQHKRFEAILSLIEKKFKGTAELSAKGLGGSLNKLSKTWDDFLKVVGSTFQVAQPAIDGVTAALGKMNAGLDNNIDDLVLASDTIKSMRKNLQDLQKTQEKLALTGFPTFKELLVFSKNLVALGLTAKDVTFIIDDFVEKAERLAKQAETLQFRAGDEEGLRELIANIDTLIADIDATPISVKILGGEEVRKKLKQVRSDVVGLRADAEEAIPVRVKAILDQKIDEIRELRTIFAPPVEIELIAASGDDFAEQVKRVRDVLDTIRKPQRRGGVIADALITDDGVELVRRKLAEAKFSIEDITLDPRLIEEIEQTKVDLRANVLLDPTSPEVTKFEKGVEGLVKRANDALSRAFDEQGNLIAPKAAAEFLQLADVFVLATQQAQKFVDTVATIDLQKINKLRVPPTTEPAAALGRQLDAQREALQDTLRDLLNIRGAPTDDVARVMNLDDIRQIRALIEREVEFAKQALASIASAPISSERRDEAIRLAEANLTFLEANRQRADDLTREFGEIGDSAAPGLELVNALLESSLPLLEKVAAQSTAVADRTREFWASTRASIEGAFDATIDALITNAENFADAMRSIFKSLVADLIKELLKLAAFNFIKSLIPGGQALGFGGSFATTGNPGFRGKPTLELPPIEIPDTTTPVVEFSRLLRAQQALQRERPIVVKIEEPRQQPDRGARLELNLQSFDGVSVRRQVTTGALRRELERELRRSSL